MKLAKDGNGEVVYHCPECLEAGEDATLAGTWSDFYDHMRKAHGWEDLDFSGYYSE
jgi:uncharacterized C2H2 Zn-finger protein